MSDPAFRAMSVEDCLLTEELSPVKRESVEGFVYPLHAQAGTFKAHALVTDLIVEQSERRVYVYQRAEQGWNRQEVAGLGQIAVPRLGTELDLEDIYADILA